MARKKKCVACECKDQMIAFLEGQLEDAKAKLWSAIRREVKDSSVAAAPREPNGNAPPNRTSLEDAMSLAYQDIGDHGVEEPARPTINTRYL